MSKVKSIAPKGDSSTAPAPQAPVAAPAPRPVEAYVIPPQTMDSVLKYLAVKPWNEVENIINQIKATVKPIFKPEAVNETENQDTPDA